ncbi:MAG: hypothetical protein JWM26_3446 [Betaproteobacteria bacterium]|nr:hypothetical protein [Betaproteobacteria bacterium]
MVRPIATCFLALAVSSSVSGCFVPMGLAAIGSVAVPVATTDWGNVRLVGTQQQLERNYAAIRNIVLEEAKNNGFPNPGAEVRPTASNGWRGRFYFSLQTGMGTDQLTAEFRPKDGAVELYMHGAGNRADPKGAIKAVTERISPLFGQSQSPPLGQ